MADYDVVVIGGGPAGYSAALAAASRGAIVALIEAERVGGACVHYACIPTNILLDSATTHLTARELSAQGVFDTGDQFSLSRAVARKNALVRQVADGVASALRMRKVTTIAGRATFCGPSAVEVLTADGSSTLSGEAFVIATGTRWEPPTIAGVEADRVVTADVVQSLSVAPRSVLILADGPADTAFGIEYAVLLAAAGSTVTLATARAQLLPGLDAELAGFAAESLRDLGIQVIEGASLEGQPGEQVAVQHSGGVAVVDAELVVAADTRRPYFATLNLPAANVRASERIEVDARCCAGAPNVFAAGDVTGGAMLSSVAAHEGGVAGINATGGEARVSRAAIPQILHAIPPIAWLGLTEERARAAGYDVTTGVADLSFNPRAVALGGRQGIVKIVAARGHGQLLGVHVVGPEASEIVAVAAGLMQAEATLDDLGAMRWWHPSVSESLGDAARRARQG